MNFMDTLNILKEKDMTSSFQELLDKASNSNEILYINKGTYKVSSLFIHSNTHIIFENGAIIEGIDDEVYPLIDTRVAGINMPFYAAVLNIIDSKDVIIEGEGVINGAGPYFWEKYWGTDTKGGMRKIYDAAGLRWACDYDCLRPRNVLVQNSSNVILKDITSKDSAFWNFHILYSHDITLDSIKVLSGSLCSPSTDGIDIDSSYNVLVTGVSTSCNDDSICIKSGRDYDGLMTGIPSHDITITDSIINKGFGITIGSEVSGGVYNVNINNIKYYDTDCAIRIKSTSQRKGYIKNIKVDNITCLNVKYLFHFYLNWNPLYNKCVIPNDYKGVIKGHWYKLIKEVPNLCNTIVDGINISNLKSDMSPNYDGISRVFNIEGFSDSPIKNISFNNLDIKAYELGFINYTHNIKYDNVSISILKEENKEFDEYDNR